MFVNDNVSPMDEMADVRTPRRRQARGERRIAEILDAASRVLTANGYDKTTTNAIAAEAGISPGSLYQYFRNKEEIAAALAATYGEGLRSAYSDAFHDARAGVTPAEAIDQVVDPILAFNVANPAFKVLLSRPDMPALTEAVRPLHEALLGHVTGVLASRLPDSEPASLTLSAQLMIQAFQAAAPAIVAAEPEQRPAYVAEVKRMLTAYLTDLGSR